MISRTKCGARALSPLGDTDKTTENEHETAQKAQEQIEVAKPYKMLAFSSSYLFSTRRTTIVEARSAAPSQRRSRLQRRERKFPRLSRLNGCVWGNTTHTVG